MRSILLCVCSLFLASCSSFDHTQKSITKLAITKQNDLLLSKIWPLKGTGTYLQKIDVNTKDQAHSFLLHLTLEAYSLKAVAIHTIQGRI